MPIAVKCSDCGKQYRLKDETAGKSFDCKECGTKITVPRPRPKKPKNDDSWDDTDSWDVDDDDGDDFASPVRSKSPRRKPSAKKQPARKRSRKKKKSGISPILIIGGGFLALLILGGGSVAIMKAVSNKRGGTVLGNSRKPNANAVDFEEKEFAKFKRIVVGNFGTSIMMPNTTRAKQAQDIDFGNSVKHTTFFAGLIMVSNTYYACEIVETKIPQEITPANRKNWEEMVKKTVHDQYRAKGIKVVEEKDITLGSLKGHETRYISGDITITTQYYFGAKSTIDLNFYELTQYPKPILRKRFLDSLQFDSFKK